MVELPIKQDLYCMSKNIIRNIGKIYYRYIRLGT